MAVQPRYLDYVLEQLAALPALRANRMFGGVGLYSDGLFFGLIDDDTLFFKTGESNIEAYRSRNMPRFMPFPDRPEAVMGYHEVPADIIEDAESLVDWARKAVAVAASAQAAKAVKRRTSAKPAKAPKPRKKSAAKSAAKKTRAAAPSKRRRSSGRT